VICSLRMKNEEYQRLSSREREEISRGLAQGAGGRSGYRAFSARNRARTSASSRKLGKRILIERIALREYVEKKIAARWSPEQIAVKLTREYPHDTSMRVSHEAIYQYIYVLPRGSLKRSLIEGLRQERAWRRKKHKGRKSEETRGKIADMLSIEERPLEVASRTVPGHWEGDLIMGKYKRSALGTLVERTTRYTMLVPLKRKDAETVRKEYARALRALPRDLAKTLTYDQGKEMSEHKQFTIDTGITVYFAHPGSPWERGTNENTNGLIRQFFPKGTEFDKVPLREIRNAQDLLNDRPRKVLDYEKPFEAFTKLVALNS
jgi:transposase, IS30 family